MAEHLNAMQYTVNAVSHIVNVLFLFTFLHRFFSCSNYISFYIYTCIYCVYKLIPGLSLKTKMWIDVVPPGTPRATSSTFTFIAFTAEKGKSEPT